MNQEREHDSADDHVHEHEPRSIYTTSCIGTCTITSTGTTSADGAPGARGDWGGERGGWGGGRRMRRGDIRTAVLVALREGPANGYEVMRRLEEMSGGLWRPSPGSVYPHLQMLEEAGVVESDQSSGSRSYSLTEAGGPRPSRRHLPFGRRQDGDDELRSLRLAVDQLVSAAKQLSGAGVQSQIERGIAVIQKARKELYQILAED